MPRPGKKKAYVLAKAAEKGRLTAQIEHEYKDVKFLADMIPFLPEKYKKNAVLWMKHIFEKHMDKIPKAAALIGMTLLVKLTIDTSEQLMGRLKKLTVPIWQKKWKPHWTRGLFGMPQYRFWEEEAEKYEGLFPDWADWLIAFSIAYVIVEHGGDIIKGLGEGVSGLTGLVGFLLG